MNRIPLLLAAVLLATAGPLAAQEVDGAPALARNTLAVELGGHGGLYSFGYERLLSPTLGVRIGFSYFSASGSVVITKGIEEYRANGRAQLTLVPLAASWLRGDTHHLELGGGVVLAYLSGAAENSGEPEVFAEVQGTGLGLAGLAGYRYQKPEGGIFFRAAYTPLWSGGTLSPGWFGISLGYTF